MIDLAQRAAAGDLTATRRLLECVQPAATRMVVGVLGAGHPDIDDVLQQAQLALVQALPAFRGECHPAGYASRIAVHIALRYRTRHQSQLSRREALARLSSEAPPAAAPSDPLVANRRRKLLQRLLTQLPPEQAETLALRVMLGYSLEEVAATTGAPVNTVRSRVRLAKEALRRAIMATPDVLEELEVAP